MIQTGNTEDYQEVIRQSISKKILIGTNLTTVLKTLMLYLEGLPRIGGSEKRDRDSTGYVIGYRYTTMTRELYTDHIGQQTSKSS